MTMAPQPGRKRGRPRLGQELSTSVSLRLDQASVARLRDVAQAEGIGPTTLLRRWVLEQLQATDEGKVETTRADAVHPARLDK